MEKRFPGITAYNGTQFRWGERTFIMGIVNMSPDSFSGDGLGSNVNAAVEQARRFVDEGADIIDVGGESTRPDALPVDADEELRRVIPAIEALAGAIAAPISIDTSKSTVARRALEAGAKIVNDVWGLKKDPLLASVAAGFGALLVITSNQRLSPCRGDIMAEVLADLRRGMAQAEESGVPQENIIIDPGIGFGKTPQQNMELIRRLGELKELGRPILLGTSRKSVIEHALNLPPGERIFGTAATVALGIAGGADIVRVHDVRQMAQVCRMTDAIIRRQDDKQ